MTTAELNRAEAPEGKPGDSGLIGASRLFAWLLIICGVLGITASAVITHDKMKLLENPDYVPACSLNPIFSCKNIMESDQASVFGFPNPYIGWVAFSMLVVIGAGLLAGGTHKRWWWLGLWAGGLFGAGFVTYLQYASLYEIQKLCVWCCLAWVVTILVFWYTTVHNVRTGVFKLSASVRSNVLEFHWVVPVLWIGLILMLIYLKWGSSLWA